MPPALVEPAPSRRSICVIPFVEDAGRGPLVLVLLRVAARTAGWQPVTGRVESTDASLEAACVRELGEETGFGAPAELLDLAREWRFVGYDGVTYEQRTFAARYSAPTPPTLSDEHEDARWLPAHEARTLLTWEENRESVATLEHLLAERRLPR